MICIKCGTAVPDANGVCAVCDPWGVAVEDARPGVQTATAASDQVIAGAMPAWLIALTKKHRPRPVNLDAAYRRSVTTWRLTAAWRFCFGLQFLATIVFWQTPAMEGRCFLALWAVIIPLMMRVSYVSRRGLWLGAAISQIGLRGEAGLQWLAGLGEVRRVSWYNVFTGLLVTAWAGFLLVLSKQEAPNLAFWLPLGIFYLIALQVLLAGAMGAETRAYKKVCAFLAAVPPTRIG